jgi:hypothetical protein
MESIIAKRELGNGRWDRALKRNLVELSVADNYDDAKEEWIATGEVWWEGNENIPDWVSQSQMGASKCLCGHIVVYHFQIVNTENGVVECVGSDHINTYLIMRAIAKDEGISMDAITDEKIQEWIDVRTKSMKAEAWWKANGAGFEMMFDSVKEMDLHLNVHKSDKTVYNTKYQWYENETTIRKRSSGVYGSSDYQMASIVWRWNHPDNPKAQINTTGYPNDNLMKDLSLLYVKQGQYLTEFNNMKQRKEARLVELEKQRKVLEEKREKARIAQAEAEAERLRIWNLPENVEKRRIEEIERKALEYQLQVEAEEAMRIREEKRQEQLRFQKMKEQEILESSGEDFVNLCEYYDVPVFNETFADNDWERTFLASIKERMLKSKPLTDSQYHTLRRIMEKDPATEKQRNFLLKLGYEGELTISKREASKLISRLLKE